MFEEGAIFIFRQVVNGLEYLHSEGVYHRFSSLSLSLSLSLSQYMYSRVTHSSRLNLDAHGQESET